MTDSSSQIAMCKSQNKHNRIQAISSPLHEDLPLLIENGEIYATQDVKARGKRLSD
jgi:elongation factor 2